VVPELLCHYRWHGEARLTNVGLLLAGRRRFVAKHAPAMGPACLAYHRARVAMLARRARGRSPLTVAGRVIATTPPPVTRILAAESMEGRIGRLRGDPARSLRRLHSMVAALE
jgi:hypothetical protein